MYIYMFYYLKHKMDLIYVYSSTLPYGFCRPWGCQTRRVLELRDCYVRPDVSWRRTCRLLACRCGLRGLRLLEEWKIIEKEGEIR